MDTVPFQPQALIGSFRRFGEAGPVYEVTGIGSVTERGDQMMRIHVFDSGEDAEYKLSDLLDDPAAD